jgi:ATP-dependent protease ClpP protease subunit
MSQAAVPFYTICAKAEERTAEVLIYGDIGESWWGESVTAKQFVQELDALDVDTLTLRINSPGGSVTEGIAIHNAIRRHKAANKIVVIDGVAASIASLIAMAGDTVQMSDNAAFMVHAPWGFAMGNSAELREYADLLDFWAEAMSASYARKTGKTKDDMLALLTDGKDHWYTAAEAKEAGFVDEVIDELPLVASAGERLPLAVETDRAVISAKFKSLPPKVVSTPAAAAAQPAHKETTMSGQTQTAAEPQAAEAIEKAALAKDTARRNSIKSLAVGTIAAMAGVSDLIAASCDDVDCTVEMAREKLLAHIGKNAEPLAAGHIVTVEDETDKFRRGVSAALQIRAGLAKNDGANEFRGYTLYELARASLERGGVKTSHMDKMGVVAMAFTHTTSDFTNLLADVANKSMLKGYEEADETFQRWTNKGVLSDFKTTKRVGMDTFPALDRVAEGAEYKYATIGDRGESIVLATYGKLFSISRQAIINDDLDSFSKIPRLMGRAAIRTVGNLAYAVLTANGAMSDGKALFHADHKNLLTAAVPSTASVDAMMAAMRKQKDGKNNTLNIRLAYLLTPVSLEGTALTVANSEFEVGTNKDNTTPNYVRGRFEVISDARLDEASTSVWYGAANPDAFDTVEVAYLDGVETPTLEQQTGWGIDGVEMKVRMDAGVKALEYRTLAKNPYAG